MCRPLEEVVASQNRMLERLGKEVPTTPNAAVISAFQEHVKKIRSWLTLQSNISVLYVDYLAVLQFPEEQARRICDFLGRNLDVSAMIAQVQHSLHRERSASAVSGPPRSVVQPG